jgi:bifunctional ADP-heptose synthase (sugar kinase/adenylyltransferase)
LAPVLTVAVKVFDVRSTAGVNVAVMPAYFTVPEMIVVPCFKVNVAAVIVAGSICSLKVALTVLLTPTSVAVSGPTTRRGCCRIRPIAARSPRAR